MGNPVLDIVSVKEVSLSVSVTVFDESENVMMLIGRGLKISPNSEMPNELKEGCMALYALS